MDVFCDGDSEGWEECWEGRNIKWIASSTWANSKWIY